VHRRFTFPLIAFEENDVPSGEQQAEATPAPTPEIQPGPWSADLETYIQDPAARAQADRFLREKIQPRVTKFEQESSQYRPARELYDDLINDPDNTLVAVATQIYGEDVASKLVEVLSGPAPEVETPAGEQTKGPLDLSLLPPQVQELIIEREQNKAREVYQSELARVKEAHPTLVDDEFHPFVVSAEGNMDAALEAYKRWQAQVTERYGPKTEEVPPVPPLGLGGDAPKPVVAEKYRTFDEAFDAAMDDWKAPAPAPVGTV
jgi:hypothetical protein